ncbi:hypothetical protein ACFYKT_16700 [Cytobacillus sp. FJAT-53684]|uniref:IDEAL domain-containing protein n=1 Tax=Cytobacillus mangrovibacter TaxID=3299024 RepID=A0ABW6K4T0_9BACI
MLEEKAKEKNEKILEQIMIHLATNNRSLQEEDYKELMNSLTQSLDKKTNETFNREKFEELRLMTNMGANKS